MSRFVSVGPILVALALSASPLPSHAQPPPGTIFIRGSVGMATQSLSDWRAIINAQKQILQSSGIPLPWENIGTAFTPSFELDYMVNDVVSVGASLSHQKGTSNNSIGDFGGSLSQKITASAVGLRGNVSFWPRRGRGFFVGADAGIGFGKASLEVHVQDLTTPGNDLDVDGRWDGTGFIGGPFAGLQRSLGRSGIVALKAWYQFARLGAFDGTETSPQLGTASGPPRDGAGNVLDTDLSGVGICLAIGASFGGGR